MAGRLSIETGLGRRGGYVHRIHHRTTWVRTVTAGEQRGGGEYKGGWAEEAVEQHRCLPVLKAKLTWQAPLERVDVVSGTNRDELRAVAPVRASQISPDTPACQTQRLS